MARDNMRWIERLEQLRLEQQQRCLRIKTSHSPKNVMFAMPCHMLAWLASAGTNTRKRALPTSAASMLNELYFVTIKTARASVSREQVKER